jgi:N-acetylmuramic acid 6-phosphate etherase
VSALEDLLTEQPNPASEGIDARPTGEILRIMNEEDRRVAEAVSLEIPAITAAVDAIAAAFRTGGRLYYIGAGTSGRLGVLDASECPPTFSVPPDKVVGIIAGGDHALRSSAEGVEDDFEAGARDVASRHFRSTDVLVGIAASGRTPYVLGAVRYARQLGAVTVGLSCSPDSDLSRAVQIPITPVPGPEVVTGSTRLKAGSATKLVLNMLTTAAFIRCGYVYGNLMVNLQPSNVKLIDRARRIISRAAGVDYEKAAELLSASGLDVRAAIVMGKAGVSAAKAGELLESAGGRISEALRGAGEV